MERVRAQLGAAYPQAGLREIPAGDRPDLDPAWQAQGEEAAGVELRLRRGRDLPLASNWYRRADPLKGVLAAAASAREGERVVCQLVLAPAPAGWADGLRSRRGRASRRNIAQDRDRADSGDPPAPRSVRDRRRRRAGLPLVPVRRLPASGWHGRSRTRGPAAGSGAGRASHGRQATHGPGAGRGEAAHPALAVQLRVLAFGPPGSSKERLRTLVASVAEAYQAFDHPAGNGLRAQPWQGGPAAARARRAASSGGPTS